MVAVYFDNHDNTLAGGSKFSYNVYNHSKTVAKTMNA